MALDHRALIVDLTPPILLRLAQRARRYARGIGTFTLTPRRDTSVMDVGDGYDDDKYAELIVANKLRTRKLDTNREKSWYLILPLVVSQCRHESLTVLDFGGGAATGLFSILDLIPGFVPSRLSYVLVETTAMCRAVREKIVPTLPPLALTIVADIPAALAAPLIINIGSAIQYIPKYRETLARFATLSPQYIIVSQTPMTDGPTSTWHQHHPYRKISGRMFNRSEFIAEMRLIGYACIFMVDHGAGQEGEGSAFRSSMVFRPYSN